MSRSGPPREGAVPPSGEASDRHRARLARWSAVSGALTATSDDELRAVVASAPTLGSGIGGSRCAIEVHGTAVFVKRVPLSDLERRPEHAMSTSNLFDLPLACQYGVGSPSFGAWREVAANAMATEWVLDGRCAGFAPMYHWRVIDGPAFEGALPDDLADADQAAAFWGGSEPVRKRVEAIATSTATVALFLEHIPETLPEWLGRRDGHQLTGSPVNDEWRHESIDRAVAQIERALRTDVAFMNGAGLFHFDAHLANMLVDRSQLVLADFGLATSPSFDLSAAEVAFLRANRSHDMAHTITRLVDWLVMRAADVDDWQARDEFIERWAMATGAGAGNRVTGGLTAAAAGLLDRYAPVAVVINEFYRRLHLETRSTRYPTAEAEQACADAGLTIPDV